MTASLADGGRMLVFLGAGFSLGAAHQTGRSWFDNEHWDTDPGVLGVGGESGGFGCSVIAAGLVGVQ